MNSQILASCLADATYDTECCSNTPVIYAILKKYWAGRQAKQHTPSPCKLCNDSNAIGRKVAVIKTSISLQPKDVTVTCYMT
jgi:hypothetical protein